MRWALRILGTWFAVWFGVGLFVVSLDLDLPGGPAGDVVFLALAAALVLLAWARDVGWGRACAACAVVGVVAGAVEWLGAETGFLFGEYDYTGAFGPRLGGVLPVTIPLAWWVVVAGGLDAVRRLWPGARAWQAAVACAVLAVVVDLALETVAFHIRGYWLWEPVAGPAWWGVPWTNFAGWFALALTLAFVVETWIRVPRGGSWRVSVPVYGAVVATFVAANLVQGFVVPALCGIGALGVLLLAWRRGMRST